MTPRYPLFVALAGIAALLCVPTVRAEDASAVSTPAVGSLTLDALEAAAPKEWKDQAAIIANQERAIAFIQGNTLRSGEDFFRASNLFNFHRSEYRIGRIQYELSLAAIATGYVEAEKSLPAVYDIFMGLLGRPARFDFNEFAQKNPEFAEYEAAPDCVRAVWRDPASARAAAATSADNAEVKAIVDADQADRQGNWGTRSEEERNATQQRDKARNVRIQEIITAGDLHTTEDFARASLVMQHSARFTGYRLAHELAVASLLLGDRSVGRWLVTATYDRMLRSSGLDQRFGTQLGPDGPLRVDESGICDNERTALGCPTLAEARSRPARNAQRAKDVALLTGPDNTLRDAATGVSAKVPEGWNISSVTTVGPDAKSIPIVNPKHANSVLVLYYRTKPTAIPPEGAETLLRQQAATKAKERQSRWPDYKNRADSFVFRELNGRPALAWSATYTEGGQACIETLTRVYGENSTALVFLNTPSTQAELLRPALESFAASLQLP